METFCVEFTVWGKNRRESDDSMLAKENNPIIYCSQIVKCSLDYIVFFII